MKVTLVMVQSLDGKIARNSHHNSISWTSKEDTKHFVEFTKKVGTIVMGSKTFESYGQKVLPGRRNIIMTSKPEKYESKEGVEFFSGSPEELINKLGNEGVEEIVVAGGTSINTAFLEAELIDEIYLTIEPVIFGEGMALFNKEVDYIGLELIEKLNLNPNTLLLHYKVIY